jgi:hypothetical protein
MLSTAGMLSINWVALYCLVLASGTVFFPYFIDVTLDTKRDHYAVDSVLVDTAYSIILAMSIVFSLNGMIDVYNGVHHISVSLPGLLMTICVAISSMVYVYEASTDITSENKLILQICIASFHNIVIMTPLVFHMLGTTVDSLEAKVRLVMVPLAVFAQFSAYPFPHAPLFFEVLLTFISVFFTLGCLFFGLRGVYFYFNTERGNKGFEKFQVVYHVIWMCFVLGLLIIYYTGGQKMWSDQTPQNTAMFVYLQITAMSAINSLPYRMAFHDAEVDKVSDEASYVMHALYLNQFISSMFLFIVSKYNSESTLCEKDFCSVHLARDPHPPECGSCGAANA